MADERRLPGDVPLWEVPDWLQRFGVRAGITGRGTGAVPFDLGLWTGQPVGEVIGRWRAFRSALPRCPGMVMAHQVHADRVLWHPYASTGWTVHERADGHATNAAGLALVVTVADCVPVYLVAPKQRAIALLHAGWRGTAAGILSRGLEVLQRCAGVEPADLILHAGVAISGPCYQVGREVVEGVGRVADGEGPWNVDLREVLLEQAGVLGVGEVTASSHCTSLGRAHFFSHRGSEGRDGRQVAYLGFPLPETA